MTHIKERQQALEPGRVEYARKKIEDLGYKVTQMSPTTLQFTFMGSIVRVFPYSGWFTGKSVKDGRGIHTLLNQIKQTNI